MTLLGILAGSAVLLTIAMFISKQSMLGFPSAIFWAITGAQSYILSTTPWGDIYFYLFFASMFGMTIFTAFAAYGLREKRDAIGDEEMEKGEGMFIDESKRENKADDVFGDEAEPEPNKRTKELRERAEQRRAGVRKPRYRFE